ncbi:L-serine ammonia-lyase [Diaphorobacter aerolatus]|uniref:L-serine dehydratase n=1 Tax=Diaphorobacter aerolatus TaxID=1288495 RepID=A0A7H0GG09_9BURK|nr:L-serine ammonia-lyase [Diaphorobacter aerolatus]QNP47225.1 L-serine ammonia-lyase [Diaphorobacter aerolatus]
MAVSVFDLFKIGIGPSSSHTVGPMRAARQFVQRLARNAQLDGVARLRCVLYGSLGATGRGHASDRAVILGLAGFAPDTVDVDAIDGFIASVRREQRLALADGPQIAFKDGVDLVLDPMVTLPFHANGMRFEAWDAAGRQLDTHVYYSVGGGFIVGEEAAASGAERQTAIAPDTEVLPLPFHSAEQLLEQARAQGGPIAQVMRVNERHWRSDADIDSGLLTIWRAMQACVERGCGTAGELPGGFRVRRRAPALHKALVSAPDVSDDPLQVIDWVNLFALAVNEENAAGGRVVTAPTNGAAGIVPAVLHYYTRFIKGANERGVIDFLLTSGAIGILYKENASISGAEVGCQGEVGVACSMAAAGLCAVLGGTPEQVENAAEIGMEHHLGLTCDPVGGLVQIPCIERNALAAVKAINAARMALRGDGTHHVSLDQVIKTMRETGADMMTKYKETSRGGLAVNIVEC